jgi:hypothetical protein
MTNLPPRSREAEFSAPAKAEPRQAADGDRPSFFVRPTNTKSGSGRFAAAWATKQQPLEH